MDVRVRNAVRKDVFTISENTNIEILNEIMLLKKQEEVLVVDEDQNIVGIITRDDLTKSLARNVDRKTKVKEIMSRDVITMPKDKLLVEARSDMQRLGINRAPVLDEDGKLLGIITGKTICHRFSDQLEKSTTFLDALLECIETAICVVSNKGDVIFYNKVFEAIFQPSKSIKLTLDYFLPEELIEKIRKGEMSLENLSFENQNNRKFNLTTKPFDLGEGFAGTILNITETTNTIKLVKQLDDTNYKLNFLEERLNEQECNLDNIVSKNPLMRKALQMAKKAANTDYPILIKGERGTGKKTLTKALHMYSSRKAAPLIKINCAAIPSNLFEREFFGLEGQEIGLLELSDNGTLFIDEVENLPRKIQEELLDFLRTRSFTRVKGTEMIQVDTRIITATHCNLKNLIEEGKFLEELYNQIATVYIELPSLRNRREDIIQLVDYFIKENEARYKKTIVDIDSKVLQRFLEYDWPGNIQELRNIVEQLVILSDDGKITLDLLPEFLRQKASILPFDTVKDLGEAAYLAEKKVILDALKKHSFNKTKTAQALKISRSTLYNKINQYGINI